MYRRKSITAQFDLIRSHSHRIDLKWNWLMHSEVPYGSSTVLVDVHHGSLDQTYFSVAYHCGTFFTLPIAWDVDPSRAQSR
jgi:hypothetical protein